MFTAGFIVREGFVAQGKEWKPGDILVTLEENDTHTKTLLEKGYIEVYNELKELKKTVLKHFPELWKETEACLSAIAAKRLKEYNDPITLFLVGAASSGKTTVLSFLYDCEEVFKSDNFTPKSFVSHAANVKAEKLEEIDLLPKIRDKTFVCPELAPIFGKGKEDIIENFAIMARVLDGEGFESDSGSKGHRGYSGKYRFTWLGATTPLEKTAWDTMSRIGHRILFCKMDTLSKKEDDYVTNFLHELPYADKIEMVRLQISPLIEKNRVKGYYSLGWNNIADEEQFKKIVRIALLVRRLRAKLSIWMEKTEEGESHYNYSTSLPESPERLISALYNLARGRAILYNRAQLNEEDIEMVYRVALSSMPFDRSDFFLKILKKGGTITTEQVELELKCTKATARKVMQSLDILGVVDPAYDDLTTKRMGAISLKSEFRWILKDKLAYSLFEEIRDSEYRANLENK